MEKNGKHLIAKVTKRKVDLNKRNVCFNFKEDKPVDIFVISLF